jgi:uncharacterized protein DUF3500
MRMPIRLLIRTVLLLLPLTMVLVVGAASHKQTAAAMADGATKFLASLSAEQRQKATFAFEDEANRLDWHFIPRERKGLPLKDLDEKQRDLALAFLRTGLSAQGYKKATSIMELEKVLGEIEAKARAASGRGGSGITRDPINYYFSVFGTPAPKQPWGWRVEGHHISLNFTVVNGELIATSPSFFGSNPAEVKEGPQQGLRILKGEEDLARALLQSLTDEQRKTAILDVKAPNDIVSFNSKQADPLSPDGIAAAQLTPPQRDMLKKVIDEYAGQMTAELAADRLDKIQKGGFDKVHFAWAGEAEHGKPHYYRIQGPSFLIEYDNTQNNANHIHSVWRDFAGDFGRDLIREHVRSVAHQ